MTEPLQPGSRYEHGRMTAYGTLDARLRSGDVILLDGAIGTQLQRMGVPMNNDAWAATSLNTHPTTVRHMHEKYIRAGVDVITTNSYASARHNFEPLGLGDLTGELNLRAAVLAREARERVDAARPIYIAGSVSSFGITTQGEPTQALHRHSHGRSAITAAQAKDNLHEQAAILADAGVDLLLAESTGGTIHREWVLDACLATGLPTWVGFKCRLDPGDGLTRVGYESNVELGAEVQTLMSRGGCAVSIFHSDVDATSAAITEVRKTWCGPLGVYPEAQRDDYTAVRRDESVPTTLSVADFRKSVSGWIAQGVQIIGGCCGVELEYIEGLRDEVPSRIPSAPDPVAN